MAQLIRKYNTGGAAAAQPTAAPTPAPQYPTMLVNGKEVVLDDNMVNYIREEAAKLGGDPQYFIGKELEGLLKGGASLDTTTNTLQSNIDRSAYLSKRQQKRMGRRVRYAAGDVRDNKEAIYHLSQIIGNKVNQRDTLDLRKALRFEYETDDAGNYKLDSNGNKILINTPDTAEGFARLDKLGEYLANLNADWKGWNGNTRDYYQNWYNNYTPEEWAALRNRIQTGTYTDADVAALSDIGYTFTGSKAGNATASTTASVSPQQQATYQARKDANFNRDALVNQKGLMYEDENGNIFLTDLGKATFGQGNLWINDNFRAYNSELGALLPNDLFIIGGQVFTHNDSRLTNLQAFRDWVALNRANRFDEANSQIKSYWAEGQGAPYINITGGDDKWNTVFGDKEIYGRNATNEYDEITDDQGNKLYVYEYIDEDTQRDNSAYDYSGYVKADRLKTVVINPETGERVEVDPSKLRRSASRRYDDVSKVNWNRSYINDLVDGQRFIHYKGRTGVNGPLWNIYYNPDSKSYYYQSSEEWGDRAGWLSSEYRNNPAEYLHKIDPELWAILEANPELLDDPEVQNAIRYILQSPYLGAWNPKTEQPFFNVRKKSPALADYGDLVYATNRGRYRNNNTPEGQLYHLQTVASHKQGGILKAQVGARTAAIADVDMDQADIQKVTQNNYGKRTRDARTEKIIGDGTALTSADWWDLAALGADALGVGLGFAPGAHIAGSVAGFGGSAAGFVSDVKRDGFQMRDLLELGANVGIDTASLFMGSAAKAAKMSSIAGRIVKLAPVILSVPGISSAVKTSVENFVDNSWTIDDLRTVVNGLAGIRGLRRSIVPNVKAPKGDITFKHTSDSSLDVKGINKAEVERINALPENKRAEKLNELIQGKLYGEEMPKYKNAEAEFQKVVEANKTAHTNDNNVKLWDEVEIAKQRKDFFESKGLDPNKQFAEVSFTDYEGIDYRPDKKHWWDLPGKAPKIKVDTYTRVPMTSSDQSTGVVDKIKRAVFRPAIESYEANLALEKAGVSPEEAMKLRRQKMEKPAEVKDPGHMDEPKRGKPLKPWEEYVADLKGVPVHEPQAPIKPDILNEHDLTVLQIQLNMSNSAAERNAIAQTISDFKKARADYQATEDRYLKDLQTYRQAVADYKAKQDAEKATNKAVRKYKQHTKKKKQYEQYIDQLSKYNNVQNAKKLRAFVLPHIYVNNPYQPQPKKIYLGPSYVYKKGGKILKGSEGLVTAVGQLTKSPETANWTQFIDPLVGAGAFALAQIKTKQIGKLNEKAAVDQLEAQLKTPFRESMPIRSNQAARNYMQMEQALASDRTKLPHTSDAGINLAQNLATQEQANALRVKAFDDMAKENLEYRTAAQATDMKNRLAEHEAAQNNFSIGKLSSAAKHNIRANTLNKLGDNLQAYIAEGRQKLFEDKKLLDQRQQALELQELQNIHESWLADYNKLSDEDRKQYTGYLDYAKQARSNQYKDYELKRINALHSTRGMYAPWMYEKPSFRLPFAKMAAKGIKVREPLVEKMVQLNAKLHNTNTQKTQDRLTKILLKLMK